MNKLLPFLFFIGINLPLQGNEEDNLEVQSPFKEIETKTDAPISVKGLVILGGILVIGGATTIWNLQKKTIASSTKNVSETTSTDFFTLKKEKNDYTIEVKLSQEELFERFANKDFGLMDEFRTMLQTVYKKNPNYDTCRCTFFKDSINCIKISDLRAIRQKAKWPHGFGTQVRNADKKKNRCTLSILMPPRQKSWE